MAPVPESTPTVAPLSREYSYNTINCSAYFTRDSRERDGRALLLIERPVKGQAIRDKPSVDHRIRRFHHRESIPTVAPPSTVVLTSRKTLVRETIELHPSQRLTLVEGQAIVGRRVICR